MTSLQTIRTLTVRGNPEGLDSLAAAIARVKGEQTAVATASETSARRALSAASAWERLQARTDPVARAYQQLTRDLATAGRALDQGVAGVDEYSAAVERMKRGIENVGVIQIPKIDQSGLNAFLGIAEQVRGAARDSASAFEAEFERLDDIARMKAEQAGLGFRDGLNRAMGIGGPSATQMGASFSALSELAEREAEIEAARRVQAASTTQIGIADSFGIGRAAPSARASAAVFEEAAAEQDRMAAAAAALRAQIDPLAVAQDRLNAEVAEYRTLAAAGFITTQDLSAGANLAQRRFDETAKKLDASGRAAGFSAHQWQNLGFQVNDAATMALSGSSAFQILATQGGQVFQIISTAEGGATAALKGIGTTALGLVTPFSVAAAAAAGVGIYAAVAYDRAEQSAKRLKDSLEGLGRTTGLTVADLRSIAANNSGAGGLSIGQAEEAVAAFASTGKISAEVMSDLTQDARAYAQATKQEVGPALAELAQAFANPSRGAETLNQKLEMLDDRTLQYIISLDKSGNRAEAAAVLQRRVSSVLGDATTKLRENASEWEKLANSIAKATNWYGQWLQADYGSVANTATDQSDRALIEAARGRMDYRKTNPIMGWLTSGDGGQELDEQMIRDAEERIRKRAEKLAKDLQAPFDQKSIAAGELARNTVPDTTALDALIQKRDQLAESIDDPRIAKGAQNLDINREALARYQAAIETYLTPAQKAQRLRELDIAALNARTPAEKAEVAAARARVEVAGDVFNAINAETNARHAANQVLTESATAYRDEDRARSLGLRQQFESRELDVTMAGASIAAREAATFKLQQYHEIEREALTRGKDWAEAQRAEVDRLAEAWGDLAQRAAAANLVRDLVFDAQQVVRSRGEQQIYSQLRSAGQLSPSGQIESDQAKTLAATMRATQVYEAQADLIRDINFETQQLGRTESERAIHSQFRSAGLLDAYGEISGAANKAIADQMRLNDAIREASQAYRGFGKEALEALAKGNPKGIPEAFLTRTSDALLDSAGKQIDDFISQGINQAFGGNMLGLPTAPDTKAMMASVVNLQAATVILGGANLGNLAGGSFADLLTKGANGVPSLASTGGVPSAANSNVAAITPNSRVASAFSALPTLSLSPQEVVDLKKTLMTEWVTSAGEMQAAGITDTILNRKFSGQWGPTVTDVVNARSQFSAINGRPGWQLGRNSVDDIPDSALLSGRGLQSSQFVDGYLAQRAAGAPSSVGGHLNYANPNFSDASNMGWINRLEGPTFGAGNAIHRHGTAGGLRPVGPYQVGIAGGASNDNLGGFGGVDQLNAAAGQAASATSNFGATAGNAIPGLSDLSTNISQFGSNLTSATDSLSSSGGGLAGAATSLSGAGTAVAGSAEGFAGGLGQAFQQILGGIGQIGQGLFSGIGSLLGGAGGGGGLLGGLIIPGILHEGGTFADARFGRVVSLDAYRGAPRFHSGFTSNEFPAILERGERVLTERMDRRNSRALSGLTSAAAAAAPAPTPTEAPVSVSFAPVYNVQGYGKDIDELKRQMAKDRAEFEHRTIKAVKKAKASNVKLD